MFLFVLFCFFFCFFVVHLDAKLWFCTTTACNGHHLGCMTELQSLRRCISVWVVSSRKMAWLTSAEPLHAKVLACVGWSIISVAMACVSGRSRTHKRGQRSSTSGAARASSGAARRSGALSCDIACSQKRRRTQKQLGLKLLRSVTWSNEENVSSAKSPRSLSQRAKPRSLAYHVISAGKASLSPRFMLHGKHT